MDPEVFRKKLYKGYSIPELFHFLKIHYDLNTIEKTIKHCLSHPATSKMVYGNPFPKNLNDLKKGTFFFQHDDVLKEFEWHYISLKKFSNEINEFLELKKTFEKELIYSNFIEGRKILESILNKFGYSLWYIQNRFLIDELQFGKEENWKTRHLFFDKDYSIYLLVYVIFSSQSIEDKNSYEKYVYDFLNWEKNEGLLEENYSATRDYFRFKLIQFEIDNYSSSSIINIFRIERTSSVIDRYLTFINLSQIYISITDTDIVGFSRLNLLISTLSEKINDIKLKKLLISIDPKNIILNDLDILFLDLLDLYSLSKYKETYALCKDFLSKSIYDFEIIELLVKSAIIIDYDISLDFFEDNSLLHSIIINTYHSLKKDEYIQLSFTKLYKYSQILNLTSIGVQISEFLLKCQNINKEHNFVLTSKLQSNIINPNLIYGLNIKERDIFINTLNEQFYQNQTLKILKNLKLNNSPEKYINFSDSISSFNNDIYNMRRLIFMSEFESAILLIKEKFHLVKKNNLFYEEIIFNLYYCYLEKENFYDSTILYVDNYFINENNCIRLNPSLICKIVFNEKFKKIPKKEDLIELPILFSMATNDRHYIYTAMDEFLFANKLSIPSEIENITYKFDINKIIYFLSKVCTIDVIYFSTEFSGSENVENERIKICQILSDIDAKNSNIYKDEISDIIQKQLVRKAIKYIDESKIYVNVESLKTSLNKKLTESFQRYISIKEYAQNNDYKVFEHITWKKESEDSELDDSLILFKFKDNPCYSLFSEIFIEIRDNFISSNEYGLDAYLSTRIRHGTLQNHIRSVFERVHLITTKDEKGIYYNNNYWLDNLICVSDNEMKIIQNSLKVFSERIDETIRILREENIQIKTEKKIQKQDALFDFTYNKYSLGVLYDNKFFNILNFDDFINEIISELWSRTDEKLTSIRFQISMILSQYFNNLIIDLQKSLSELQCYSKISDLINAIVSSSTNIRDELEKISQWFRISEKKTVSDFDFKTLFDSCLQITNSYYPEFSFTPDININCNITFKKETFSHFVDIIRILLDNILKHSLLDETNLEAKIDVWNSSNKINFLFCNNFSENTDVIKLNNTLKIIKNDWATFSNSQFEIIKKEGGSGLRKICKILKYDLYRKEVLFDFSIDNNLIDILIEFEL